MGDDNSRDEEEEVATFNAAACQVLASAWVAQLQFSDVLVERGSSQAKEVPRIVVGLPWPLAKMLHRILGRTIEAFEEREGEISMPKSITTQVDAAFKKPEAKA